MDKFVENVAVFILCSIVAALVWSASCIQLGIAAFLSLIMILSRLQK